MAMASGDPLRASLAGAGGLAGAQREEASIDANPDPAIHIANRRAREKKSRCPAVLAILPRQGRQR
jgi:hypothetical protein